MKGLYVSASGVIQGHHGPLVLDSWYICVKILNGSFEYKLGNFLLEELNENVTYNEKKN